MIDKRMQEEMSLSFLRLIARGHGFKVDEPKLDGGVDMTVMQVARYRHPGTGRLRFFDSGKRLDFQLKTTTSAGVIEGQSFIKYDLDVKNYNDLVMRCLHPLPLHLMVLVLPCAPPSCLAVDSEGLRLSGHASWYLPPEDAELSRNTRTVRITIPKDNRVQLDFVGARFAALGIPGDDHAT